MKTIIKKIRSSCQLLYYYLNDFHFCRIHSLSTGKDTQDILCARIMLNMHSLEKGMSFSNQKDFFGESKSILLANLLKQYMDKYERNPICVTALNVLAEYLKNPHSTPKEKIRTSINNLLKQNEDVIGTGVAGIKSVEEPPAFNKEMIEAFYASRSSVREYSDIPISDNEIEEAYRIASYTPTACNRQAGRIHTYKDKVIIEKLISNQLGGQNWCENANTLFVITANISYFGNRYERLQPLIDGGFFAMNFVMGLHLNHIATCFKMFIRDPKIEKNFKEIANIPENEIPIVLVLAGHYKSTPVCSPKSVRFNFYNRQSKI